MAETSIDQLNYGIPSEQLGVNISFKNGKNKILKDDEMENPFSVSMNDEFNKPDYSHHKNILILCMRDDYDVNDKNIYDIYDTVIKKTTLQKIAHNFALIKFNKKAITINSMTKPLLVSKEHLVHFNYNTNELNEIVVLMFELKEHSVRLMADLIDQHTNINDLKEILTLSNKYNNKSKSLIKNKFLQYLKNIKETIFWRSHQNNYITMTKHFLERNFPKNEFTLREIQHMKLNSNTDYLKDIKLENGTNYVDIGFVLKSMDHRSFYATNVNNLTITQEYVKELFDTIQNESDMFNIFNMFLISKDLCHFVLNNEYILTIMQPIFNKHLPFYRYLFGIGWLTLYAEECLGKIYTKESNRYVFGINTASKLPYFPMCTEDIHLNPYITLIVETNKVNFNKNCMGMPSIKNYNHYGISDFDDFKQKFNLFTTGFSNTCILDGLNWSSLAISGSIIPACSIKRSPLLDIMNVSIQTSESEKLLAFFDKYYKNSDIDMMCNAKSIFQFMDKAYELINTITTNLKKYNPTDLALIVNCHPVKSTSVLIHKKYLEKHFNDIVKYINNNNGSNLIINDVSDLTNNSILSNHLRKYFYDIYIKSKNEFVEKQRVNNITNNNLYEHFYGIVTIDEIKINIIEYELKHLDDLTCEIYYENDNDNNIILKICESIKFKIKCSKMLHDIEIFKSHDFDFFSTVAKFHLPCVRGIYTGDNVYLLPSCITALLTQINIDYKYFASTTHPGDIIIKYMSRNFGVLLNPTEKLQITQFISNNNKWSRMFPNPNNIYGPMTLNNEIFKLAKYNNGSNVTNESYVTTDEKYILTIDDLNEWYTLRYPQYANTYINMLKFKTINHKGYLNPIFTSLFDMINEMFY